VDWRPWGEEAFAEAKRENKPIFLSIGYSTCHWCHVMERESFEDDAIAALLNRDFIPIKVDREERPDVDRIYMSAMQALGMGGGWPLNAFLTPNLEPFYGGTYFPPHAMHGRPGMMEVLPRVAEAWRDHRADLEHTGARVLEALAADAAADTTGIEHAELYAAAYDSLSKSHDRELGGFGTAPKFPTTVNLNFLFRYWAHDPVHRSAARAIALGQLDAMRTGGIHDQIGGGFHRYSTDREWLTPHFEKMLYDQAQLAWSYLEACQITNERRYAETARGIFDYVSRDLTAKDGGFDSAEDADSEGEEGKFYVWTPAEFEAVLGAGDAGLVAYRYGVTAAGNFEHGTSILHLAHTLAETAAHVHVSEAETEKRLAAARAKLLAARERPRTPASRRQGAHRVERAHDFGVRARCARSRRSGARGTRRARRRVRGGRRCVIRRAVRCGAAGATVRRRAGPARRLRESRARLFRPVRGDVGAEVARTRGRAD
jgi:uncharacterized protein YyaL (SSP411 family)